MMKRTFSNNQALLGMTIIVVLILAAAAAPIIAPHDPNQIDVLHKFLPASAEYPLGTDQLGRCVFSRLLYGTRYLLGIAVPMMLLLGSIGIVLGTAAAYLGGKLEQCFLILCDIFMAFPPLVVVMSLVGALGEGIAKSELLEVQDLTIEPIRTNQPIVKRSSFSLRQGSTLAVVGESGSGKSMTCKAILGLLNKRLFNITGSIRYRGTELLGMDERQLRSLCGSKIAMIVQNSMTAFDPDSIQS